MEQPLLGALLLVCTPSQAYHEPQSPRQPWPGSLPRRTQHGDKAPTPGCPNGQLISIALNDANDTVGNWAGGCSSAWPGGGLG